MKCMIKNLIGAIVVMPLSQAVYGDIKPGFEPYKFQTELKKIIENDIPEVSKQPYDRIVQDEFIDLEKLVKKTDVLYDISEILWDDLNAIPADKDAIPELLKWKQEHEKYLEKISVAFDRYTCIFPSGLEAVGKNNYVESSDFMRAMILALGVETNQAMKRKESLTAKQIQQWKILSEIISSYYQCRGGLINNIIASSFYNQFSIDGEKSVSEIADSLGLKQNVTSQHLSFMKRQGLIDCRRDGKNVYYKIVHAAPKMLLQCIKNSI